MANMYEYFVTRLSFRDDIDLIKDIVVYAFDGRTLYEGDVRPRHWLVDRTMKRFRISTMTRNDRREWVRGNIFTYNNGLFSWGTRLPVNLPSRKIFISYCHHDDEYYRSIFENLFGDLVISKSVQDGEIDSDNSDEYIKQLIQGEHLNDTTIIIILIGANTKNRKHIDWELSGALNYKVGNKYAGVLGLFLPTHPNYKSDKYTPDLVPRRLAANLASGYGVGYDWTEDRTIMQSHIETAYSRRSNVEKIINMSIPQMTRNS